MGHFSVLLLVFLACEGLPVPFLSFPFSFLLLLFMVRHLYFGVCKKEEEIKRRMFIPSCLWIGVVGMFWEAELTTSYELYRHKK